MYYSSSDLEKLKIIDRALAVSSLDDIKGLLGPVLTVDKLKGVPPTDGTLIQAIKEFEYTAAQLMSLTAQCNSLQADMQVLVKCLNAGMGNLSYINDFNSLKQRHGIY